MAYLIIKQVEIIAVQVVEKVVSGHLEAVHCEHKERLGTVEEREPKNIVCSNHPLPQVAIQSPKIILVAKDMRVIGGVKSVISITCIQIPQHRKHFYVVTSINIVVRVVS